MSSHEQGPYRTDLTELTPAEISDKQRPVDIAQSMADEISVEELRNLAANLASKIQQTEIEIALAQENLGVTKWKLGEVQRAIQLAQDKNPGSPQ